MRAHAEVGRVVVAAEEQHALCGGGHAAAHKGLRFDAHQHVARFGCDVVLGLVRPGGLGVLPAAREGLHGDAVGRAVGPVAFGELEEGEGELAALGDAEAWGGEKVVGLVGAVEEGVHDGGGFEGFVPELGAEVPRCAGEAEEVVGELAVEG